MCNQTERTKRKKKGPGRSSSAASHRLRGFSSDVQNTVMLEMLRTSEKRLSVLTGPEEVIKQFLGTAKVLEASIALANVSVY